MIIKIFVFSPFQVNTVLLYDESRQCVIIDPACYEKKEEEILVDYVIDNGLTVKMVLNTHCHIDHIFGNNFLTNEFNIPLKAHNDSLLFIEKAKEFAEAFGFEVNEQVTPQYFLKEGDIIKFGNQELEVIYTPGHADGSICFYQRKDGFLLCGDVLFKSGIGRTDLPTGDYDKLIKNINDKLMVLPDDVVVYPGHGPETTIGEEKRNNPFLNNI